VCAQRAELTEPNLSLTIHCADKRFKVGDEIPVVFTITNQGESVYSYDQRDYDRSGRMWEYKLVARQKDGTVVPDPRRNYKEGLGGGLSGRGAIGKGGSFTKTIALNRWALINKPGIYTVTGTYSYHVRNPVASRKYGVSMMKTLYANSAPIEVVVKPRSRWAMGWYIRKLLRQLKKIKPSRKWEVVKKRTAIIARLAYTCDSRIVPTLIDLMYENHHQKEAFRAMEGFVCYLPHDANIKKVVLEVAKKRGLAPCMESVLEAFDCSEEEFKQVIRISLSSDDPNTVSRGVIAAQTHPDDEYMSILISIALDPNRPDPNRHFSSFERHRAIDAIAYNRTDEGVRALRALLKDPANSTRKTTKEAIRQAYKRHRIYLKYADKEYVSELIKAVTDFNHPTARNFMVYTIARTRSKEDVEAIMALLENPDKDIPIAKTDKGIQTISKLLRNPDKDIRDITEIIIRQIYRTYPGRPLREDDFPELLKEFSEEYKVNIKRFLERLKTDN
jgi:hypothetical protein